MRKIKTRKVKGKVYKIYSSSRKNKQRKVLIKGKWVHYGDPNMPEYPGTKRGDKYCARSYGILDKQGKRTAKQITSPNFWSRLDLWNCVKKKPRRDK